MRKKNKEMPEAKKDTETSEIKEETKIEEIKEEIKTEETKEKKPKEKKSKIKKEKPEKASEPTEVKPLPETQPETEPVKKEGRFVKPLGALTFIFAIIGLAAVIALIAIGIDKAVVNSNAKKADAYQEFLTPVVMNDPDSFDDISKANMSQLVDISIWGIVKDGVDTESYQYEDGKLLLPQADVEKEFKKLFGNDIKIVHQTVSGSAYEFEYDSSAKVYKLPITGIDAAYTPKVVKIEKKRSSVVLTVAYLSGSEWEQAANGDMIEPSASKYVKITLRFNEDKSYYISAIQDTDAPETV